MRHTFQKLPAAIVLALGLTLLVWGDYSAFRVRQPEPRAENETPRFCPPTIAELFGVDSGSDRVQGLVVAGIGAVAIWLALHSLRQREEAS